VLLVSNNMGAVSAMCVSALLMRSGRVAARGDAKTMIAEYLAADAAAMREQQDHQLDSTLVLKRFHMSQTIIESGDALTLGLELESTVDQVLSELCLLIYTEAGQRVAIVDLRSENMVFRVRPDAPLRLTITVDRLPLIEGEYPLGLFFGGNQGQNAAMQLRTFSVMPRPAKHGAAPYPAEYRGLLEVTRTVEMQA
jgi:hypothetical protein